MVAVVVVIVDVDDEEGDPSWGPMKKLMVSLWDPSSGPDEKVDGLIVGPLFWVR